VAIPFSLHSFLTLGTGALDAAFTNATDGLAARDVQADGMVAGV
jgi:hypothetical protein